MIEPEDNTERTVKDFLSHESPDSGRNAGSTIAVPSNKHYRKNTIDQRKIAEH